MKLAIIGRTGMLYNSAICLANKEHSIPLIITAKAAPEYTKTEEDFKDLADNLGAEYIYTSNVNRDEIISKIRHYGIDLGISINWVNIIKQKFIDAFRLGVLNAHAGDLPRYRGNACPNWAILNGEKEIALSIHYMEGGKLDSGDIVCQRKYPLNRDTTIGDIYDWLLSATVELYCEAVEKLEKDPEFILKKQSDDQKDALRCYPRIPSDSEIDWNKSAEYIYRLIRASSEPFAGAYTYYKGEKLVIWKANLVDDEENYCAIPGQVSSINRDGSITVITGDGKIKIKEISYQGQERIKPREVIKSIRVRLGLNYSEEIEMLKDKVEKLERLVSST